MAREKKEYTAAVTRKGDGIILPETGSLPEIINVLQRLHEWEETVTAIGTTMSVAPWDGAYALQRALKENTGVFIQNAGSQIEVEVDYGKTEVIPWGSFELPGMDGGTVATGTTFEEGLVVFQANARVRRKYEARVRRIFDRARELAMTECLHRGKAFSMQFRDDDGDALPMPKPKFFRIAGEDPIFSKTLQSSIDRNILTPVQYAAQLRKLGKSMKKGVLLAGPYGVGKTLLASYLAREVTKHGWTYIYVKDAEDLYNALRWAVRYQPVVVQAEDVDRVAGGEHRTDEINELLNQIDGIDSKATDIITVLTSNHPEHINSAMRRPGRIDLVLEVNPPDAETVQRMLVAFCGKRLQKGTDLSEASAILNGEIPARIKEAVERAGMESLRRTGDPLAPISGTDLVSVAHEVIAESKLFRKPETNGRDGAAAVAHGFGEASKAINDVILRQQLAS